MGMRKNIYFSELSLQNQLKILEGYGADTAAELGYDTNPFAAAIYDKEGNLMQVELFEPAV